MVVNETQTKIYVRKPAGRPRTYRSIPMVRPMSIAKASGNAQLTIAVQAGDTLNGVLNGTFNIAAGTVTQIVKAYCTGTQWIVAA